MDEYWKQNRLFRNFKYFFFVVEPKKKNDSPATKQIYRIEFSSRKKYK